MELLFVLIAVAVIGGAAWSLTRKTSTRGPVTGGGSHLPEDPKEPINEE
jgi:hypothetical protein